MRTLTCAAVVLAAIAGAVPVMAQSVQPAPAASLTIQAQPLDALAWATVRSPADMSGQGGGYDAYGQPN